MVRVTQLTAVAALVGTGFLVAFAADEPSRQQSSLDEPFVGVTTNGTPVEGLFPIHSTGVSTEPVRVAAVEFLASLSAEQREATQYAVDDIEWRKWSNTHRYGREGVSFGEMTGAQQEKAWDLLRAGLSAKGVERSRDIMRLNQYLGELIDKLDEYGEGMYWLTVMGAPSATEPWGWQLDGHHLVINYFILGDQVVMVPAFMGSEPVFAESGRFAGIRIMEHEQDKGLALMRALTEEQQHTAIIGEKTRGNALAQAFRDNLVLDYAGVPVEGFTEEQRALLLEVVDEYVGNMSPGHAAVRMEEVKAHLSDTYFGWMGGTGDDDVFYYRIHSPVVLIEFDHQGPIALGGERTVPTRSHVHALMRTPNGNDYGKDLLRQHYEAYEGDASHGHRD